MFRRPPQSTRPEQVFTVPAGARSHRAGIDAAGRRWLIGLVDMDGIDVHEYLPAAGVPGLATLQLPPGWDPSEVFSMARPETYLHCVSSSRRRACPPGAALLPDIENGVSLDIFAAPHAKRRFAEIGRAHV